MRGDVCSESAERDGFGQRGGGSVAERRRDDANVRRWGRVHFAYKGVSSTSRTSHEAEGWSSEMLERRTALEFLSSDALGGGIDAVHVRCEMVNLPPATR